MVTSWYMLPKFRERKSGVIVNIASRAATVDFPFAVGYNSSKAAVARATSTLQEEVELDGLGDGIQLYALHPGGVPTAMAKSAYIVISPPPLRGKKKISNPTLKPPEEIRQELLDRYPALTQHGTDFQALFKDPPELCGATVTYLAAGKAKELRGMYWDCRQDIERVKAYGREKLQQEGRYTLKMQFLDGYENEP
jgi:short-subunit dehydrogenase